MKLISVITASLIGTSLAFGVTPNAGQKPDAKPDAAKIAAPSLSAPCEQPHRPGMMPDMTQMPDSHLQATILFRQNGQDLRVDTAGHPLPEQGTVGKVQPTSSNMQKSTRANTGRQSVKHLNSPVMHT